MCVLKTVILLLCTAHAGHAYVTDQSAEPAYIHNNMPSYPQNSQQPSVNHQSEDYHAFLLQNDFTYKSVAQNGRKEVNSGGVDSFHSFSAQDTSLVPHNSLRPAIYEEPARSSYPTYNDSQSNTENYIGNTYALLDYNYEQESDNLPTVQPSTQNLTFPNTYASTYSSDPNNFSYSAFYEDPATYNWNYTYNQPDYQNASATTNYPAQTGHNQIWGCQMTEPTPSNSLTQPNQHENLFNNASISNPTRNGPSRSLKRSAKSQIIDSSNNNSEYSQSSHSKIRTDNKELEIPMKRQKKDTTEEPQPETNSLFKNYTSEMINETAPSQPTHLSNTTLKALIENHRLSSDVQAALNKAILNHSVLTGAEEIKDGTPSLSFYNRLNTVVSNIQAYSDSLQYKIAPLVLKDKNPRLKKSKHAPLYESIDYPSSKAYLKNMKTRLNIDEETELYFKENTCSLMHTILNGLLLIRIDNEETPRISDNEFEEINRRKRKIYNVNGVVLSEYLHSVMTTWWTAVALFFISEENSLSVLRRHMQGCAEAVRMADVSPDVRLSRTAVDACTPACWHLLVSGMDLNALFDDYLWFYSYFVPASQLATTYLPDQCEGSLTRAKDVQHAVFMRWLEHRYFREEDLAPLLLRGFSFSLHTRYMGYFKFLTVQDYMSFSSDQLFKIGQVITRSIKNNNIKKARLTFFIITADLRVLLSNIALLREWANRRGANQFSVDEWRHNYDVEAFTPDDTLSLQATELLGTYIRHTLGDAYFRPLLVIPAVGVNFWQACVYTIAKHITAVTSRFVGKEGAQEVADAKEPLTVMSTLCQMYDLLDKINDRFKWLGWPAEEGHSDEQSSYLNTEHFIDESTQSFLEARSELTRMNNVPLIDSQMLQIAYEELISAILSFLISEDTAEVLSAGSFIIPTYNYVTSINCKYLTVEELKEFPDIYRTPGYSYFRKFNFIITEGLKILESLLKNERTSRIVEEHPIYIEKRAFIEHLRELTLKGHFNKIYKGCTFIEHNSENGCVAAMR